MESLPSLAATCEYRDPSKTHTSHEACSAHYSQLHLLHHELFHYTTLSGNTEATGGKNTALALLQAAGLEKL